MSACLLFSMRAVFQRRHDRSSATRFNASGSNSRGTKQKPSHIIILMTASCHEQHHTALTTKSPPIGRTREYPIWLPLHHWALYGTTEYNSFYDGQPCLSFLGLFSSAPVCRAWRQAFCLSECLLKLLMRYLSAGWGHSWKECCVFITLDRKSESSWLPCLWSCSVTE